MLWLQTDCFLAELDSLVEVQQMYLEKSLIVRLPNEDFGCNPKK